MLKNKSIFKVIPQKQKLPNNFFETFRECSLPSTVSKNSIKRIGHPTRLRDMMGQSYHIYAEPRALFHQFKLHFVVAGRKGY